MRDFGRGVRFEDFSSDDGLLIKQLEDEDDKLMGYSADLINTVCVY
jgi:hypothetical protein